MVAPDFAVSRSARLSSSGAMGFRRYATTERAIARMRDGDKYGLSKPFAATNEPAPNPLSIQVLV